MAIGRLDEDSEGLLLTTDGMMSEIIRSKKVDKEYYVQVDGVINQQAIDQIKRELKSDLTVPNIIKPSLANPLF
jgi:23S rRNA pseudouridine2457 synthase